MSDSSLTSPINIPPEIDASSGASPGGVEECTVSDVSSLEVPQNSDPSEIGLPEEDADELAWHKATLILEEDIRERVTIPAEFPARHLWSPFSSLSYPSSPAWSANIADHIILSPVVLAQASAELSNALSPSSQLHRPTSPGAEEPLPEPVITLFCPFDHTAGVIDTLVNRIAASERADVLVLDSLMFAQGKDTSLGPGQ